MAVVGSGPSDGVHMLGLRGGVGAPASGAGTTNSHAASQHHPAIGDGPRRLGDTPAPSVLLVARRGTALIAGGPGKLPHG